MGFISAEVLEGQMDSAGNASSTARATEAGWLAPAIEAPHLQEEELPRFPTTFPLNGEV